MGFTQPLGEEFATQSINRLDSPHVSSEIDHLGLLAVFLLCETVLFNFPVEVGSGGLFLGSPEGMN